MDLNWGWIGSGIVVWLLTTGTTWLIAARITTAVLREQNANLKNSVEKIVSDVVSLGRTVADLTEQIAQGRTDRVSCELRSSRMYATRGEIARLISDQTVSYNQLTGKIDELSDSIHSRVTRIETGLAELRGAQERNIIQ